MFCLPFVVLAIIKLIVMEFLLAESAHTVVRIDFVRDHLELVEVFNKDELI